MKKVIAITIISTFLICLVPLMSAAQSQNYVVAKVGTFTPESADLTKNGPDYGTGFNGEVAGGYYISPNFAGEFGIGWFKTTDTEAGFDTDIQVVPVTLTMKALYPIGGFEPYVEAGVGAYFCNADLVSQGQRFSDTSNVFGVHLGLGLNSHPSKIDFRN